jgi:hypothetical protein
VSSTVRRLAAGAASLAMLVALGATPGPARAASVDFGRPTLGGSFDTEIVASQPVTIDETVDRVEVLVWLADSAGPVVSEVEVPATSGETTLRYSFGGADEHILPNTPVRVRWRVTADGAATLGPEVRTVIADERFDWQTLSGDVVRVHWYEGDRAFGERALRIGEQEVEETAALFGVEETDPVDFFIYADNDAFYDVLGPGTRENVGGQANAEIRTMFAQIAPSSIDDPWVENVVPHELIHLVFDSAVDNPYHFPPRWLNEGLAVYLSVGYEVGDRAAVESAAEKGQLIPLDGLAAQFPTSGFGFSLAYSESVSAVDYLIRTHGQDTLVSLVRSYADGRTDDEAFEGAIGMDVAAFNDAWLEDIGAKEPVKHGPRPAPPGPRPADWGAVPSPPPWAAPGPVASGPIATLPPVSRDEGVLRPVALPPLTLWLAVIVVGGAVGLLIWSRVRSTRR